MEEVTQQKQVAPTAAPTPAPAPSQPQTGERRGPGGYERRFNPQSRGRFGRPGDGRGFRRGGPGAKKDEFESKLLDLARVSHTRAGGRRLRFRAIVISGNKAGKVGLGVASGLDVSQAVEKATYQSKKSLIEVPVVNETISHEIMAKVGPARVLLKPQQKGRGLMAGGVVRTICQLAGIKNISSKLLGTTKNKLNNGRATIEAFKKLKKQANLAKVKIDEKAAEAVSAEKPKQ